jgi:uroporphyrinogen decarboxylase
MTPRERRLETLLFGKPDRIPFEPGGPRESTIAAWRQQGLDANANYYTTLLDILGIPIQRQRPMPDLGVSFKMIPQFEEKVLEHRDGHYIVQDWMGAITEISDRYDYTYIRAAKDFVTRKWHKFPVQSRKDWDDMAWRFDPTTPGRHPDDLAARCEALKHRDGYFSIHFNGPFWQLREWLGFEGLCTMLVDEPDFVVEMIRYWTEFVSATLRPVLERVQLDQIGFSEDMAYKGYSMISPEMVRRFLVPSYDRWISEARQNGCPVIFMDSDGFIGELIPIWIEVGINCCTPIEVAAGNDIVEFRRAFGKKMAYTGGIDKRALAKGGAAMEREVLRVVPPLLVDGGFIPGCDHGVPPDISWGNFVDYARLLARLTGWL